LIPSTSHARAPEWTTGRTPVAVVCAGGYRSSMGASLLARNGFTDVSNVIGGTSAWIAEKLPVTL